MRIRPSDDMFAPLAALAVERTPVGLILPSGWFGRPYDNALRIAAISRVDDVTSIVFAQGMRVRLVGPLQVHAWADSVSIRAFTELEWSWLPFGAPTHERLTQHFSTGILTLVNLTPEAATARTEWWRSIEARIRSLTATATTTKLPEHLQKEVYDFLNYGELGLALLTLCDIVREEQFTFTEIARDEIVRLADDMDMRDEIDPAIADAL